MHYYRQVLNFINWIKFQFMKAKAHLGLWQFAAMHSHNFKEYEIIFLYFEITNSGFLLEIFFNPLYSINKVDCSYFGMIADIPLQQHYDFFKQVLKKSRYA